MRVFAVGSVAIALTCGSVACLIAYSDYDNRFQIGDEGGPSAFVTDEASITAITVTQTDLFYATGAVIKRAPLDGGTISAWWTDDAAVTDLASDRAQNVAWTAQEVVRKANVSAPQTSTVVASNVGQFDRLASNAFGLAWFFGVQDTCPCTLAGVEPWSSTTPTPLTYDDADTKIAAGDIAIDEQGVTLFVSGRGIRRYGLDGTLSCTEGASAGPSKGLIHFIAASAPGLPYFSIESSGALESYISACSVENASGGPSAIGLIDDGSNIFWLSSSTNALCGPSIDAGTCATLPGGTVNAMAYDAQSIYVAIGSSVYRIAKP